MPVLTSAADRLLGWMVPKATASAACSGTYEACSSTCTSFCNYVLRTVYVCRYKPNCTDTCVVSHCGCAFCGGF